MKSKKIMIASAGAFVIAMTACSADEQLNSNTANNQITFCVTAENQTRALHSYCANEMPTDFKLWADYVVGEGENASKKLYIDGDVLSREGNSTSYQSENLRYWPEDDIALNFYAYVDAEYTNTDGQKINSFNYNGGQPKFENFTVNSNVEQQLDLLYATNIGATKGTTGNVTLNFRHALSQICFKAKSETTNLRITINSVSVTGLAGTATYNLPNTVSTNGTVGNHNNNTASGTPNRGSWAEDSFGSKNQSYTVALGEGITLASNTKNLTSYDDGNEDTTDDDYSKVMNLIPQSATEATTDESGNAPTDGFYFTLNLKVENIAHQEGENGDEVLTTIVENKAFYIPASINWEQGNRYIYTFNFADNWTPDGLTPITYTVTVDDFVPASEKSVPESNE